MCASFSFGNDSFEVNAPSLNIMLGNGFAKDGNHGGLNADMNLEVPIGNWGIGFDLNGMAEHAPFMGVANKDPLEDYSYFGVEFEKRFVSDIFVFTSGIGIGDLSGASRTALKYSDTQCASFYLFDCPESKQVTVSHYDSQQFETISFNPLIRMNIQLFKYFGIGLNLEAYINKYQGLGSASFMIYFGNKTTGKKE
jgi:hypothetical protein